MTFAPLEQCGSGDQKINVKKRLDNIFHKSRDTVYTFIHQTTKEFQLETLPA